MARPDERERNNPMVYQELKHLRAEVERLKKERGFAVAPQGEPIKAAVEYRNPQLYRERLLNLVVALENFIGPEQGKKGTPIPAELRKALEAATVLIRPVKAEVKQ